MNNNLLVLLISLIGIQALGQTSNNALPISQQHSEASLKSEKGLYASKSVLSEGKWVKISIYKTGIHQIDYNTLATWGFLNPTKVKIFGNGGDMLPRANSAFREDDLVENPIYDNGKALLFYAKNVVNWKYNSVKKMYTQELNNYDNGSYYYITENNAQQKSFQETPVTTAQTVTTTYVACDFHEQNSVNLIKSGRAWLGEQFEPIHNALEKTITFSTPDLIKTSTNNIKLNLQLAVRSEAKSTIEVYINQSMETRTTATFSSIKLNDHENYYAELQSHFITSSDYKEMTSLRIKYNPEALINTSLAWLDAITINTLNNLTFHGQELIFRNPFDINETLPTEFRMSGALKKNIVILDVTNPASPSKVPTRTDQDTLKFIATPNVMQSFVAFEPSSTFTTPIWVMNLENQNLHAYSGIDYIIVCPNEFINEASALAQIHSKYNNINPSVVVDEQIYNEFSSGKQDPLAIRAFMRMIYERDKNQPNPSQKYLLLYGDGSYDNLGVNPKNTSKIVTYQSDESLHQTDSYVSDDAFAFLEPNEGYNDLTDHLSIGVGRLPINTTEEARIVNKKILTYLTDQDRTDWQTTITLLTQDETKSASDPNKDGNTFPQAAEDMAVYLRSQNPEIVINKIYADAYKKNSSSTKNSYPEAETAVQDALSNKGSLIFNYTGHGSTETFGYNFLNIPKADMMNNIKRLPFLFAATCEVGRYDNPESKCLSEHLLLNQNGGTIGNISAARIVYAANNNILNLNFYKTVFKKDSQNEKLRLGEIFRQAKNMTNSGGQYTQLNYSLMCDPALRLNYPTQEVRTMELKDVRMNAVTDTMHGLSLGRISGEIVNQKRQRNNTFNGQITITIYDKISNLTTQGNGINNPFPYEYYQNILYRGKSEVKDGKFQTTFMLPKDIKYNYGKGKITFYAASNDSTTASGIYQDIIIGDLDKSANYENEGPEVELHMNSLDFVEGGLTSSQPLLMAKVEDDGGINTSGNGIGHDLQITIDDDPLQCYVLNTYFEFENNSYRKGSIRFQLPTMPEGKHTATIRVWDCNNNSTTKSITFEVSNNNELEIFNPILFPNPISMDQTMKIFLTHDEPNATLTINMAIYAIDGTLLDQKNYIKIDHNGITPLLEWSPRNENGVQLNAGMYICKLWLSSSNGKSSTFSKRFILIP